MDCIAIFLGFDCVVLLVTKYWKSNHRYFVVDSLLVTEETAVSHQEAHLGVGQKVHVGRQPSEQANVWRQIGDSAFVFVLPKYPLRQASEDAGENFACRQRHVGALDDCPETENDESGIASSIDEIGQVLHRKTTLMKEFPSVFKWLDEFTLGRGLLGSKCNPPASMIALDLG